MVIEPGQDMSSYPGVVGGDGNGGNNSLPHQDGGALSQAGGGNLHPINTDSSHGGPPHVTQTRFPMAAQNPMFIPSRKFRNYISEINT